MIWIGGNELDVQLAFSFSINDCPYINGVGYDTPERSAFAFNALDGKFLDGIGEGSFFTFGNEKIFGLQGLGVNVVIRESRNQIFTVNFIQLNR